MHHNHHLLLAKVASAQIANQNRPPRFKYFVPALPHEDGAENSTSRPFVTTVLRPINPVASVTLRDLVESAGDCFTLAYEK